ncbi:MAG: DUF454 family protein [Woeseiaceae bacterium]|nr:DUF454 family protein [Woeseiaceae bacterium]
MGPSRCHCLRNSHDATYSARWSPGRRTRSSAARPGTGKRAVLTRTARLTWLVIGLLSLAVGALGVALPLLPTTPFILVAAFAFARSSNRLHNWLINHDVFGALISNWQRYGAISRRAKAASVMSMAALLAISLALAAPKAVMLAQLVVLGAAALFILSRPAPPAE